MLPVALAAASAGADHPDDAWAEWGETKASLRVPRRVRPVREGTGLYAAMAGMMRQRKVAFAELAAGWDGEGGGGGGVETLVSRFGNRMSAGGIGVNVGVAADGRIVVRTETVLDVYLARDFLLLQKEVVRVTVDNVPFTPGPAPAGEGEGEDEDEDEDDEL
jgi:hypothetical protein